MKNNKVENKITTKGSLGILAYGDIGIREWRKVKKSTNEKQLKIDEEE